MIRTFRDKDTERLYRLYFVRRFSGIERQARRRLRILESAQTLKDLAGLPSNHFEALKGDRMGEYSIRINDQWRICFEWPDHSIGPLNVEIVDYH